MTARIRIRDSGGTLRTIDGTGSTRIRMRDAGNVLRTITRIRMRDDTNVLRVVYDVSGASSFSVAVAPTFTAGVDTRGDGSAVTGDVTATATGGTGPYNYAWTLISHSNATPPTINSPAAATTHFRQTNIAASSSDNATFRVTATDSLSSTGFVDVPVTWTSI